MSGAAGLTDRRPLTFPDGLAKARYIDFMSRLHAHAAPVRALVDASRWRDLPPRKRAEAIHAFLRDRIAYVRDPGRREELADAGVVLQRRLEDCDGKAHTFVALARASGLDARIRPIFQDGAFTHVQAEVRWPGSQTDPRADADGWLVAELILAGVPLGSGAEAARRVGGRVLFAG